MQQCPGCGEAGLSNLVLAFSGPAKPARCRACGRWYVITLGAQLKYFVICLTPALLGIASALVYRQFWHFVIGSLAGVSLMSWMYYRACNKHRLSEISARARRNYRILVVLLLAFVVTYLMLRNA